MERKNKCVFLVDDNIVTLNVGKTVLQNKYTVVTISSGEKLLQILKKVKPDLILLDIGMPGINGYDIIKEMKNDPEDARIPVVFLTGKTELEDEVFGLSLGAVDYISKPFSPPLLLKRIEQHLLINSQKKEIRLYNNIIKQTSELLLFNYISNEYISRYFEIISQAVNKNFIIDLYDILISEYPYKNYFSTEEALRNIFEKYCVGFDSVAIDLLIKLSDKIKINEEVYEANKNVQK